MKQREEIILLKKWLKKDGNSAVILASAMGYQSSSTVSQWLRRGRISKRETVNVLNFIKRSRVK